MKKHTITAQEYEAIKTLEKNIQNKRVSKRLQVLLLRYEGKKDREIGEKLDYDRKRVSQLCAEYKRVGLEEYARHKYGGNNRNMTPEEERAFLEKFEEAAKAGQVTTISEIALAYDELTGKKRESRSTVYYLLHKHGWRIISPQTVHPGKASDEVIETSKKLTTS
jgi:transposase